MTKHWIDSQRPNGNKSQSTDEELRRIERAYLLIIDDILPFDMDKPSEFYKERVNSLANDRNNRILPTIITSNRKLSEIGKLLGDPTMDRIKEMCHVMHIEGRNWRLGY